MSLPPANAPPRAGRVAVVVLLLVLIGWNGLHVLARTRWSPGLGLVPFASYAGLALLVCGDATLVALLLLFRSSRAEHGRRRVLLRLACMSLMPIAALGAEVGLRASGNYASWNELNGRSYQSPWSQDFPIPWIGLDSGVNARFGFGQPEFDFAVQTNSEGLRDEAHPLSKPAGERRVVCLGDSFTMGQGAEQQDGWPQQLGRLLRERGEPGTSVRIICGGVAGSDPVFEQQLFVRRLAKYSPDLVILMLNDSDVVEVISRGGMDRFDAAGRVRPRPALAMEWLFARCHLFRAVLLEFLGFDHYLMRRAERAERTAWALGQIADVGESLRDMGRERGFELLVVVHPVFHQLMEPDSALQVAPVGELLRARQVPFLDLTESLRQRIAPDETFQYFWRADRHCNARGYALFAQGVADHLLRAQLVPR